MRVHGGARFCQRRDGCRGCELRGERGEAATNQLCARATHLHVTRRGRQLLPERLDVAAALGGEPPVAPLLNRWGAREGLGVKHPGARVSVGGRVGRSSRRLDCSRRLGGGARAREQASSPHGGRLRRRACAARARRQRLHHRVRAGAHHTRARTSGDDDVTRGLNIFDSLSPTAKQDAMHAARRASDKVRDNPLQVNRDSFTGTR